MSALPLSLWVSAPAQTWTYVWGTDTVIIDGVSMMRHTGVDVTLFHPFAGAVQPVKVGRQFSCVGCPHLGIDEYGQLSCAHPEYLTAYGCPQGIGSGRYGMFSHSDCPMWSDPIARRRWRQKLKWKYIFWNYYHESGKNGWKYGFGNEPFALRWA